ncbi:MAG: hypothetical protein EOP88_14970 [Verrucomicrobiaceae bacterium]|nr:MAG: hypothetical protein EOP88_14970 [Verrucomicrobiaceae bacterium]
MKSRNSSPAPAGRDSNTLVTVSEVAEQVGREILESRLEPGAWATALYECDGKRQDALAVYTRLRVRQLTKQRRVRLAKVSNFEARRLAICMGDQATRDSIARTVQEMLGHGGTRKAKNFAKPRMSLVWMSILFFGTAGTVASFGRLFSHLLPESITSPLTMVALLAGVGVVWSAMVLRYYLPKRWIMLGWNSGLVVTCNLLCLCSVLLGTKVIKRAVASGESPMATEQRQAAAPVRTSLNPATSQNAPVRTSIRKSGDPKEPYLVSATPAKATGKQ